MALHQRRGQMETSEKHAGTCTLHIRIYHELTAITKSNRGFFIWGGIFFKNEKDAGSWNISRFTVLPKNLANILTPFFE